MRNLLHVFALLIVFLLFPSFVIASKSVGVQTGKIQVDQKLVPGGIYELPTLVVSNTGSEKGDFEVGISTLQDQAELKPLEEWFIFTPKTFSLDPGKSQQVTIKINLPIKSQPGNYFSFVEGRFLSSGTKGTASVTIAAASKLYFTVISTNPFVTYYYKIISLWKLYSFWIQAILIIGIIIVVVDLFNKFFKIKVNRVKKHG